MKKKVFRKAAPGSKPNEVDLNANEAWIRKNDDGVYVDFHAKNAVFTLGPFKTHIDAANAANKKCKQLGIDPYYPDLNGSLGGLTDFWAPKYEGVRFDPTDKLWEASIDAFGEPLHIGKFQTEELAAWAVNDKCIELNIEPYNPQLRSHGQASELTQDKERGKAQTRSIIRWLDFPNLLEDNSFACCGWDAEDKSFQCDQCKKWWHQDCLMDSGRGYNKETIQNLKSLAFCCPECENVTAPKKRQMSLMPVMPPVKPSHQDYNHNVTKRRVALRKKKKRKFKFSKKQEIASRKKGNYRGVSYYKERNVWEAFLNLPEKHHIGYFQTQNQAVKAVNEECTYLGLAPWNREIQEPERGTMESKFTGVFWSRHAQKWHAQLMKQGRRKPLHIGYFTDEIAAAEAWDQKAIELLDSDVELNFPQEPEDDVFSLKTEDSDSKNNSGFNTRIVPRIPMSPSTVVPQSQAPTSNRKLKLNKRGVVKPERIRRAKPSKKTKKKTSSRCKGPPRRSKYIGVSWCRKCQKWKAQRVIKGKNRYGGTFSDEEEAARTSDRLARQHGNSKLNFSDEEIETEEEIRRKAAEKIAKRRKQNKSSQYRGVSYISNLNKWSGCVWHPKLKKIHVGTFKTEIEAANAVNNKCRELNFEIYNPDLENEQNMDLLKRAKKTPPRRKVARNGVKKVSKYRGVSWHQPTQKWRAQMYVQRKSIHIGTFVNEKDAARAVNRKCTEFKLPLYNPALKVSRQNRLVFEKNKSHLPDYLKPYPLPYNKRMMKLNYNGSNMNNTNHVGSKGFGIPNFLNPSHASRRKDLRPGRYLNHGSTDSSAKSGYLTGYLNNQTSTSEVVDQAERDHSKTSLFRATKDWTKTEYEDVIFDGNKYRSQLTYKEFKVHLGMFSNAREAALAVNKKCTNMGISLRNPGVYIPSTFDNQSSEDIHNGDPSSDFVAVYWKPISSNWTAEMIHNKARYYCGVFETDIEAAWAVNNKCKEIGIPQKNPGVIRIEPEKSRQILGGGIQEDDSVEDSDTDEIMFETITEEIEMEANPLLDKPKSIRKSHKSKRDFLETENDFDFSVPLESPKRTRTSSKRKSTEPEFPEDLELRQQPLRTCEYQGVTYLSAEAGWAVCIFHNGSKVPAGTYGTMEEAARVHDTQALRMMGEGAELNFPEPGQSGIKIRRSIYAGVNWNPVKGSWEVVDSLDSDGTVVGTFDDEFKAAIAYDANVLKFNRLDLPLNFPQRDIPEFAEYLTRMQVFEATLSSEPYLLSSNRFDLNKIKLHLSQYDINDISITKILPSRKRKNSMPMYPNKKIKIEPTDTNQISKKALSLSLKQEEDSLSSAAVVNNKRGLEDPKYPPKKRAHIEVEITNINIAL